MHKYTFEKTLYVELAPCLHCNSTSFKHVIGEYPVGVSLQPFPLHVCTGCNAFFYNEHDLLIETVLINTYKKWRAKYDM